ncbi:MAG: transposase [Chitinophagales bacterium]|nr:transposase [Bacteroidota bacterium]MCB9257701.1 transposase [Chitinophagales bacterium]
MKRRKVIRYSESFKIQIVKEYEEDHIPVVELRKKYEIFGGATIQSWIRKYGRPSSQLKIIKVETPKERDRIKELEKENKLLKKALSKQTLEAIISESTVEAIADMLGMNVEELKKKYGDKQ